MKYIITCIITWAFVVVILQLSLCKSNLKENEGAVKDAAALARAISLEEANAVTYDLRLAVWETNVEGYLNGYGLWMELGRRVETNINDGGLDFVYSCPVKNDAPQIAKGVNVFWIKASDWPGSPNGAYIPGFVETSVFRIVNGFLVNDDKYEKQNFNYSTTDVIKGYDWALHRYYDFDTIAINPQSFDKYQARTRIRQAVADYCVKVELDPKDTLFAHDVAVLPVTINGSVITTNQGLLNAKPQAISLLSTGLYSSDKGNRKVTLNIVSPYNNPYVRRSFMIKKTYNNGIVESIVTHDSKYEDRELKGWFKWCEYEIKTFIEGFQLSEPIIITVKK